MRALRCESCGSSLAVREGRVVARCVFCGADGAHLVAGASLEVAPDGVMPFVLDRAGAVSRFGTWAESWLLAPLGLREAALDLQPVLVPVVRFSADLDTRWSGTVAAKGTSSGRRPVGGRAEERVRDVYVAASRALTGLEIRGLGAFGDQVVPWDPEGDVPWEVERLSHRALYRAATEELKVRHLSELSAANELKSVAGSTLVDGLRGEALLAPVYVGSFQLRGAPWRVLVNGVTGQVVADRPWSRIKVATIASVFGAFFVSPCVTGPLLLALLACWRLGLVDD